MSKVKIEISLDCPCGHCSADIVDIAVHINSCKDIEKLPPWLAKWIRAVVEKEVSQLR